MQSYMCLAYLAIWWAALFPSLRVKEDFHALNLDSHDFIPAIRWWTWIVPESWLAMAAMTFWESPSRMISLRPNSNAKVVPISATLASISRAPSGYGSSLLRAPIICPLSFRTTTPIPQCPSSLNTAPSTLTLYHPRGGGLRKVRSWGWGGWGSTQKVWNSFKKACDASKICKAVLPVSPCRTAFRLFQRDHANATKVLRS